MSDSIVLTSKMLHTIRNSLNRILGYSQIIQDDESLSDEQKRMLTSIEKASLDINFFLSPKNVQENNPEKINNQNTTSKKIEVKGYLSTQKILIVDDKPENLSLITDILRPYDYDLSVALSGSQALEIIKNFHPALILLDVVMPQMSGYEVLGELKKDKLTREIPVIFLTANGSTKDIVKGFEEGVVDYIAKPFHPKELIARVHTHLEKSRLFANLKRLMEHSFHELYTPLSVMSSAMQMQELEYKKTNYTQMSLAACKTLQNIYDDLYYSINYSHTTREKTVFDFTKLLLQRINYFTLVAESNSLKFQTELPSELSVQMNPQEMERVIDNLLSNALKYTKEFNEITISLKEDTDMWIFSICNPIFKNIDVEKIFYKYYRHEEEVFGLGLGLELVQSLCKKNGIKIGATALNGLFCIKMELVQTK